MSRYTKRPSHFKANTLGKPKKINMKDSKDLEKGFKIEKKEHPSLTPAEAKQVAKDHIKENKNYYNKTSHTSEKKYVSKDEYIRRMEHLTNRPMSSEERAKAERDYDTMTAPQKEKDDKIKKDWEAGHGPQGQKAAPQPAEYENSMQGYKRWSKNHYNFMTPDIKKVRKQDNRYVELSEGTDMDHKPMYGVSVIHYDESKGKFETTKDENLSRPFTGANAKEEAERYYREV